jgi:hypothetical protein
MRTDRRTDLTKLIVVCRNFANEPKTRAFPTMRTSVLTLPQWWGGIPIGIEKPSNGHQQKKIEREKKISRLVIIGCRLRQWSYKII